MSCKDPDGYGHVGASDFADTGIKEPNGGRAQRCPPASPDAFQDDSLYGKIHGHVQHVPASRRDWFAGMALMGLNASDSANFGYDIVEATVDAARRYADAMIAELDKE